MKPIIKIITAFLIIGLIIISILNYNKSSTLTAKLNQTNSVLHKYINNDTTLNKELLTREFKEDYYITQLNITNKQMTTFVSILFSIALGISVGFFVWYMSEFKTKIENKINEANTTQNNQIHSQITHFNELGLNFANTVIITAEAVKEINQFNYVFQTLMGLANYKYYGYAMNIHENTNKIIIGQLKILNKEISTVITSNQPHRNLIWTYLAELTSIRDREIIDEVNKLRAKIKDIDSII